MERAGQHHDDGSGSGFDRQLDPFADGIRDGGLGAGKIVDRFPARALFAGSRTYGCKKAANAFSGKARL